MIAPRWLLLERPVPLPLDQAPAACARGAGLDDAQLVVEEFSPAALATAMTAAQGGVVVVVAASEAVLALARQAGACCVLVTAGRGAETFATWRAAGTLAHAALIGDDLRALAPLVASLFEATATA